MNHKLNAIALAAFCSLFALNHSACAQGTAFTYQGRLNSGGSPANGSYDLQFSLFAANAGGVAIAGPVTNSAVSVTNGLFTTTVDFGNAFAGASNWLQIAVSTNGANAFGPLSPRQQLTPTPYAIYAESANAGSLIGTLSGNGSGLTNLTASQLTIGTVPDAQLSANVALRNAVNNFTGGSNTFSGSVGIGVNNPVDLLDVAAGGTIGNSTTLVTEHDPSNQGVKVGFGYRDPLSGDFNGLRSVVNPGTAGCGNSGDLLFYTWECNTSVSREVMRINGSGNVGIGTTNPIAGLNTQGSTVPTLDVNGVIEIDGNYNLEFGAGMPGKEVSAGKIGYERFTADSLDIVGAGTNNTSRKIKFWAEGGVNFNGNVGIGTTTPQLPLDISSFNYAVPAAQFGVANCGGACGQTNWQEAIRLWNQNGNGQVGLGFLVGPSSFNSNAVPGVWIGTAYRASANDNDFQIVTRTNGTTPNLVTRVYVNGTSGNVGIGTTTPSTALQVNGTVTATSFSGSFAGSGSGLTNVAVLNAGNTFTADQTIQGQLIAAGPLAGLTMENRANNSQTWQWRADASGLNAFSPSLSQPFTIDPFGHVGVGTTTPNSQFEAQGLGSGGNGTVTGIQTSGDNGSAGVFGWSQVAGANGVIGLSTVTEPNVSGPLSANVGVFGSSTTTNGTGVAGRDTASTGLTYGVYGTVTSPQGYAGYFDGRGFFAGNLGIGTTTPAGHLSVATAQGTVNIMDGQFTPELVMTGGSVPGDLRLRNMLEVWPNTNATAAGKVDVRGTNGLADIVLDGSNGNVTCVAVNITSDRNAKDDFAAINPEQVLAKVAAMPITEWQYKKQTDTRHIGPVAQDFSSAFGLNGSDDRHICVVDEGGVALAAIQGLNEKLEAQSREKDAQIQQLEKSVADLKALVNQLTLQHQQNGGAR